ncbi:trehalase-like domain-containing protein [Jannaschia formosa]|uniref:trehalase-like domain-containing protein n=1 Tax=Jannaschia formosa TaxID=2259592 RepID=UPI000E1B93B2|nr:trehalase-like domain-containing protein [Jannaschia formosa]TFL17079.1 SinR family protein [Jannaschia formosa]
MAVFMIDFDLIREGENYWEKNALFHRRVKQAFPTWWKHLDSTFLVETSWNALQVRDYLLPVLDDNDKLLVAKLSGEAAWSGISETGSDWLRRTLGAQV